MLWSGIIITAAARIKLLVILQLMRLAHCCRAPCIILHDWCAELHAGVIPDFHAVQVMHGLVRATVFSAACMRMMCCLADSAGSGAAVAGGVAGVHERPAQAQQARGEGLRHLAQGLCTMTTQSQLLLITHVVNRAP